MALQGSVVTMTLTANSLADGSARGSTPVDNSTNGYNAALIYVRVTTNTTSAPDNGSAVEVYLLRSDDEASQISDGNWNSDASVSVLNAPLIGVLEVTSTTGGLYEKVFDTSLLGALGVEWGIAIRNSTGEALHSSGNVVRYQYYTPDA